MVKAHRPFEVKAVDAAARTFTGLASTWAVDADGDEIQRGAFAATLREWKAGGRRAVIPLIDMHQHDSVRHVFGKLEDADETDAGLRATFSVVPSRDGDEYLARIRGGYVAGLSIGFDVLDAAPGERVVAGKRRRVRLLKGVRLREVSAVIWGANDAALIDVATVKALLAAIRRRGVSDEHRDELRKAMRGFAGVRQ